MSVKNTFKEVSYLLLTVWLLGSIIVGNGYLLLRVMGYIKPDKPTIFYLQSERAATSTPKITK